MADKPKAELTKRERVCCLLILWLVKILAPWEYDHKHREFIEEIREAIKR